MYKVTKRDCPMFGIGPYVCEFICDTASDITTLPTSISEGTGGRTAYDNQKCASGSIAIIASGSDSKQYMLNNQDIWCPYSVAAGSSSGGGSSESSITVDFALSETSENPVANKVIIAALNDKADTTHTHTANEVGADANGSAASALVEAKAYTDSEIADVMAENQTAIEALDAAIGSKANKNDIPTKVSELENDSGYLTEHQDLSEYALKSKYGDTTIDVGRKANTTVGKYSTSEGYSTTASGANSHAEGYSTTASGANSHAEGYSTTASGTYSHAEGFHTTTSDASSHAEGCDTTASGNSSHAEGCGTTASGLCSHSGGMYTKALHDYEVAYGSYNESNDDTLFSIGDGTADDARHNAFEITKTGGKLHDKDIATTENISNPNLLINPDFKINQRGKSGTIIPDKNADGDDIHTYFVDRWGVDSGSVTVNADGTLTLNGTISQIFENAVGDNVTASVSAGTATYDDSTKTFSITGNGEIISWAKLEYGSVATSFVSPDPAMELLKCMRYYETIMSADCDRAMPATLRPDLKVEMDFQFKIPKRAIPSLATDTLRFVIATSTGYSTSNLSVQQFASDIYGMCLTTVDTVLTELPTYLLNVTVDTWRLSAFAVDAEIY